MVAGINKSTVLEPEIAGFVEEERVKKGQTKSKIINTLIKELYEQRRAGVPSVVNEGEKLDSKEENQGDFDSMKTPPPEISKESFDKFIEEKKKAEAAANLNVNLPVKTNDSIIKQPDELKASNEIKTEEKKELKDLSNLKNLKQDENKPVDNVNRLDDLIINKIPTSESKDINKQRIVAEIKPKPKAKFTIRKVKRVNDEEQYGTTPINIEEKVERISRKIREQEEFQNTFKDMHGKINSVCEDGKCLRNEMDALKNKLGKIDDICEDGKCIRNEIGDIKKELNEFKELKKSLDELKGGVTEIKGSFGNLDKKTIKKEPCPQCSWGVEEGSSNCPNCGLEIKEWYDEKGNKLDWKPFKERR